MDPVLLAVLTNVASTAFYDAVRDPLVSAARNMGPDESAWSKTVRDAIKPHGPRSRKLNDAERAAASAHLESGEVRQLIRNVFYTRACGPTWSITASRQAFVALWRHALDFDGVDPFAIFDSLVDACDAALDAAIKVDRSVAAHEAKSAARAISVQALLQAMEAQLRLLTGETPIDASLGREGTQFFGPLTARVEWLSVQDARRLVGRKLVAKASPRASRAACFRPRAAVPGGPGHASPAGV